MKPALDVNEIYKLMQDHQIQFSYKGPITQDVLTSLGDIIKDKMHQDDCNSKVVRRVFSVLVEAAHNILKYSLEKASLDEQNKSVGVGLIGIGNANAKLFMIFSGNVVTAVEAAAIEKRLQYLNSLSREELQKNYQQKLKTGALSQDGSAGLGLYEVARKSDRPIEYKFIPAEDGTMFFELKIYVQVEE